MNRRLGEVSKGLWCTEECVVKEVIVFKGKEGIVVLLIQYIVVLLMLYESKGRG